MFTDISCCGSLGGLGLTLLASWMAVSNAVAVPGATTNDTTATSMIQPGVSDAMGATPGLSAGTICCDAAYVVFGSKKVYFPSSAQYVSQQSGADGYFSAQEQQVVPACRLTPASTIDVQAAVLLMSTLNCQFAVRSGGHMGWAGAANIQGGVTIDMSNINQISVSQDHTLTSIGPGARWGDLYTQLDAMGLSVVGGRVSDVGVGGLIVGGGNSFFAPRYGFACDNVLNYQIVLSNGQLVSANAKQNPDLYKALKGGGNNLGIVTRFDLFTFPQGKLWGGEVIYPATPAGLTTQLQTLADFSHASGRGVDDNAAVIFAYIFTANGPTYIANTYTYSKAVVNPAILQNFTSIQPQLQSTLRTTNLTDLTNEAGAGTPNGNREIFATVTVQVDASLFNDLMALAQTNFEPLYKLAAWRGNVVIQPIPKSITSKMFKNGGNSLGIGGSSVDLAWFDCTMSWNNTSDDAAVLAAAQSLFSGASNLARSRGLHSDYIYMNYALKQTDPIAGYGAANQNAIRAASKKYDPRQVWQNQVPGGFKLYRPPGAVTCC
ncbi:hypothetical protein MMC25_000704 [Agyrium rufum]|nr:hypothetical protein [Agyrium rufum]